MVENWIYIFHQKGLHGHWIKILLLLRSIALHRMNFWTKKNEKKWEKRILKFPIEFSSLVVTKNVWTCGCFYFCLNERGKLELVTCLKKTENDLIDGLIEDDSKTSYQNDGLTCAWRKKSESLTISNYTIWTAGSEHCSANQQETGSLTISKKKSSEIWTKIKWAIHIVLNSSISYLFLKKTHLLLCGWWHLMVSLWCFILT